jgi:excisionase family DNA binding protein
MPAKMLRLREVSEYLQVNPATVRRLVQKGQLRAIRVGRDLRFDALIVEQWVAAGGSTPGANGSIRLDGASGSVRKPGNS